MNIVVVEDSIYVQESLKALFERKTCIKVLGWASGEAEALALINDVRPDVVLLDISLSSGNGLNVLRRLREAGSGTRILVLTNLPLHPYREICHALGADGFYDKVSGIDAMLDRLRSWKAPAPGNEQKRLLALQSLSILDTPEEKVFDGIVKLSAAVTNCPAAMISLVDENRQWFKARVGMEPCETSRSVSFCAHAIAEGEFLQVEDATKDARFSDNPLVRGEPNIRFYAGMPLILPGGEAIGTLCVIDHVPRHLDDTQRMALEVLANNVVTELELRQRVIALEAEVSRRCEAEVRVMHLATRDPLTGLPNRSALMDRLSQGLRTAEREKSMLAILFLDLDEFKWINDTLGHQIGDALLQEIAWRLAQTVRGSDTVARLGGDEFAIILPDLKSIEDVEIVAQKLVDAVLEPVSVRGQFMQVRCSMGVSVYPAHGENEEALLRHADLAMYQAKESGGNQFEMFSEQMNVRAVERLTLESELRQAIEGDELELHYQPQVSIRDNALTGMEALVRWNHPRLGMLSPDRFIPLAQECGLIGSLGLKVLDMAVAQVADWDSQGLEVPKMAVNISPAQLRNDLADMVAQVLNKHGVSADRIELELTETALTSDGPAVIELLRSLRDMGLTIAVDDFGVGYSSLALLRRLPITTLKIDRSFVSELAWNNQDAAIVEAVINMAVSMGLRTVAEGVEVSAQNAALRLLGCNDAQGYLFSKPAPALVAGGWLRYGLGIDLVSAPDRACGATG